MVRIVGYSLIFVLMLPLFIADGTEDVKLNKITARRLNRR